MLRVLYKYLVGIDVDSRVLKVSVIFNFNRFKSVIVDEILCRSLFDFKKNFCTSVTETVLNKDDIPWEVLKRRGFESVRLMVSTYFL
jgi:hypothetical protein